MALGKFFEITLRSVIVAGLLIGLPRVTYGAPCQSGDVGGSVFRDLNSDGTRTGVETSTTAPGMSVTAFSSAGTLLASAVVDTSGQYSLGSLSPSELASGIRLELTDLPSYFRQGAVGSTSASSVRFATSSGCAYDFAVHNAADYCESSPNLSIACYQGGSATGSGAASVVTAGYSYSGLPIAYGGTATNPTMDATIGSVGSVWGGAYQVSSKRLFMGAFLKRHVGIGPQGLGGVYVIDYSSGTATVAASFTLQGRNPANGGSAIDLGSITRNEVAGAITGDFDISTNPTLPSIDLDAYPKVGTTSFGDLALEEDGLTLWLTNLNQRALIEMDVSSESSSLPGVVNQYLISSLSGVPTCTGGTFRPFALEFHDGRGYLGGVCDAQSSQVAANLAAHVLSFSPRNIADGFTAEVSIPLNFVREPIWSFPPGSTAVPNIVAATWRPWHTSDFFASINPYIGEAVIAAGVGAAQPVLSNIRFLPNGSMVLGFIDRFSHQVGYANYIPVAGTGIFIEGMSGGDLLMVCRVNGSWVVEGAAGCANADTDTLSTVDGPNGNGEFFRHDDFYFGGGSHVLVTHSEISLGGVAVIQSSGEVLDVTFDSLPNTINVRTNGFTRLSADDGSFLSGYIIVPDPVAFPGYLGKAGGLGEPILRCGGAPIEIGNRLWLDSNSDGIQDPGETPLSGVTVGLCTTGGVEVASATTNANGNYLFSSRSGTSTDSIRYDVSQLAPGAADLSICISLSQPALSSYLVTTVDNDTTANGDSRDSDCIYSSGVASVPFSVGGIGENNHTYDCGFTTRECRNAMTTRSVTLDSGVLEIRNIVTEAASLRLRYGQLGVCEALTSERYDEIVSEAQGAYSEAWNLVWSEFPQRNDRGCERTELSCASVDTTLLKSEFLASARNLRRSARELLLSRCIRSQGGQRLLNQLVRSWGTLRRAVNRYPDSVIQCGPES